ncbi:glutamate ligase [Alkalitalea saponilacus]|uniref:Glutamate--cysteine ligase n=1 Tax=Alkalitalea saponilacus TaxID=889453 RepID=A0A1T5HSJ1_9BACT|nr:glutamate ligase [Alkalitalea saponilacus]ASB47718.1 glutamate ligase [Alkalitalea saponilacus]SKC23645.1 glutamate--cysteine ligase [Alkalitalea saponilacus]
MQDVNYMFTPLKGYEQFEATTQIIIAEIIKRGLPFEIIDEKNNLIAVTYNNREYIIHEGTISDANSLIAYWISNDKWMTKQFLKRAGISCAQGAVIKKGYSVNDLIGLQFPLVAKPANTDHGIAVSANLKNMDDTKSAIETAFEYSDRVIVEEFFTGREYRFLVVDDAVRAVAYREPANVIGDGSSTIAQLVEEKSAGRGEDYTHPLLKIKVDKEVMRHLSQQNLTLDDILERGRKVYLRENSNLSTGGDSIDVTDEMPPFYKDVASKAARAAGLRLAGIDIIINDIAGIPSPKKYIVVELNAPAMLSMHNYPYIGKNRHVEKYVLDCILSGK